MPYIGWIDVATGQARPFGSEWDWKDAPMPRAMLAAMAERILEGQKREHTGKLSPSRLMQTPRQVIIEKFTDCLLNPEGAAAMFIGAKVHEDLTRSAAKGGYDAETPLEGKLFGLEMLGIPDAAMHDPAAGRPDVLEFKVTTSGSVRFIYEAGRAKDDHIVSVNMYRHLLGQKRGVDPRTISASIEYCCMPQKERTTMGWVRMPPGLVMDVPFMDEEAMGAFVPGYSPPRREKDYQGPPPLSVKENATVLKRVYEEIADGADVVKMLKDPPPELMCMCNRRFNGQGRTYCGVGRECAVMDHGTPLW